ncbi:hypothetical protein Tco_0008777 [Tanacetum coccineum]
MDSRSRSRTSIDEEIYGNSANTYGTSTRGDSDDVPRSLDREHKCRFVHKKGTRTSPHLLLAKWTIELGEHNIVFQERGDKTTKYFLIEVPLEDNETKAEEKADTKLMKTELSYEWKLFTDGAASSDGSSIRNNKQQSRIRSTIGRIANITGNRNYKPGNLRRLTVACKSNKSYMIEHIQSNLNKKVDALSKLASMTFEHLTKEVLVEVLPKRSIEEKKILKVETKEGESWMTPIHEYLVPMASMQNYDQWQSRSQSKGITGRQCIEMPQRTLPRNSQKETPFSLTYGSVAIIPIPENDVAKDDRGRVKEVDKRRGNKEIASIEEAYCQRGTQVWQGPHMINEVHGEGLYKIVDASDYSLTQTAKSMNLHNLEDIMRRVVTLHLNIDKQVKDLSLHMSLRLIKRIKESDSKSSKSSNMIGDFAPHGSLPPSMEYDIFL